MIHCKSCHRDNKREYLQKKMQIDCAMEKQDDKCLDYLIKTFQRTHRNVDSVQAKHNNHLFDNHVSASFSQHRHIKNTAKSVIESSCCRDISPKWIVKIQWTIKIKKMCQKVISISSVTFQKICSLSWQLVKHCRSIEASECI